MKQVQAVPILTVCECAGRRSTIELFTRCQFHQCSRWSGREGFRTSSVASRFWSAILGDFAVRLEKKDV